MTATAHPALTVSVEFNSPACGVRSTKFSTITESGIQLCVCAASQGLFSSYLGVRHSCTMSRECYHPVPVVEGGRMLPARSCRCTYPVGHAQLLAMPPLPLVWLQECQETWRVTQHSCTSLTEEHRCRTAASPNVQTTFTATLSCILLYTPHSYLCTHKSVF